jgi:hypothetical protein
MAHFAEIDDTNIVVRVIVIPDDLEEIGEQWCATNLGGRWIQTSYNNTIRKQFAGIGYYYNSEEDVFVSIQPYPSWVLNDNKDWVAPSMYPSDGAHYYWDEETVSWIERTE